MVDDSFAEATPSTSTDWPLRPACISPPRLRSDLRHLRIHPGKLDPKTRGTLPAVPLAATASLHAAATYVIQNERWRFLAVQYDLLAASQSEEGYTIADAMVGRLVSLAGPETDILVVSPPSGLFVAAGPGFAAGRRHGVVNSLDIAPTILARFGFRSDGLPGKVLDGTNIAGADLIDIPAMPAAHVLKAGLPPDQIAARLIAEVERASAAAQPPLPPTKPGRVVG